MKKVVAAVISGAFLAVYAGAIFVSAISRLLGFSGDWPLRKFHSATLD